MPEVDVFDNYDVSMEGTPKPQIEIRGLKKIYPIPGGEVVALDNINLSIHKGDIYGIIGMSGAGKSTLIRCLNRLDTPSDGQIFIDGQNILAMNAQQLRSTRRRMAMIFQQFNLLMQKTVARNVRYPLEIAGVPKKKANDRVKELLGLVGLEQKAEAYPSQLSGGQKQRVAIARALASDPEMLLCDEATSALDPMTTQSILELLQEINRKLGITVVLITHEMAVIRQICNKVAILDGGKLAEQGTVDEVFMHTRSAAGKRLFGILPQQEEQTPAEPALRIVFDGASAEKPIISQVVKECGIDVNILSADIHQLNHKAYGQMMIALPPDVNERKRLTDYLAGLGLTTEEVHPQ
ncbi:MAG: ATP-binding cassette domain-containing protein [Eubacteriales bacterium]|nr:ATP-binding cassette domain-containing protein [Eubacteriales bacterium]